MNKKNSKLCVGDPVVVKQGISDPDTDGDISGWQGRISVAEDLESDGMVEIRWDSQTLKHMPLSMIKYCEKEGLDWQVMNLVAEEVEQTTARDTERDIKNALKEIHKHSTWLFLDEEGERIQRVLYGIDPGDDIKLLKAWKGHLNEKLRFPFDGELSEVSELQERGPLHTGDCVNVKSISGADDMYGIIVEVRRGREKFDVPLCDLEVMDQSSTNYQIVRDYAVWFANH